MIPQAAAAALRKARRMAVLSGAGISAESGLSTFRAPESGLWARFDPRELATAEAFVRDPALVWGWYTWRRAQVARAEPNDAHRAVSRLAQRVDRLDLITQNVDDLHERAGSLAVIHLHGMITRARCFACAAPYALEAAPQDPDNSMQPIPPPRCARCASPVRPDVVWFGEPLSRETLNMARHAVQASDLILVVGTSGLVYPAADLPAQARAHGACVIQIDPSETALDAVAHFNLRGPASQWLPAIVETISGSGDF
jgi:NAD-dependent deacetylase